MGRGRARGGRADPGARGLRRAAGDGRRRWTSGRRPSIPGCGPRSAAIRAGGARARHALSRHLPRPSAAGGCARRRGAAGGQARDRRLRGRADRARAHATRCSRGLPAARPLPAVARGRGRAAAGGRHGAGVLGRLRGPGAGGRRACLRPAVPCRGRRGDAGRLAGRSRGARGSGRAAGGGRPGPLRRRGRGRRWRRSTQAARQLYLNFRALL